MSNIYQNIGTCGSPQNESLERAVQRHDEEIKELQDGGLQIEDGSLEDVKLSNDPSQIKARVQANKNVIDSQQIQIGNNTSGVSNNATGVGNNASAIALQGAQITDLESEVDDLQLDNVQNKLDIQANKTKSESNEGRLDLLEPKVSDNEIAIADHELRITANRNDIDALSVGATTKIIAYEGTNPQLSDIVIVLGEALIDNAVYYVENPKTLDGSGMTLNGLVVRNELGNQVIGSDYNVNDLLFFRYNGVDFTIGTQVSSVGLEQRVTDAENDITDLENEKLNIADVDIVKIQTGALPTDLEWVASGNIFTYDITLVGFTCTVNDKYDTRDLSFNEIDLALIQSCGIFNDQRIDDNTIRLYATSNVDISSVNYEIVVSKDGGQ